MMRKLVVDGMIDKSFVFILKVCIGCNDKFFFIIV